MRHLTATRGHCQVARLSFNRSLDQQPTMLSNVHHIEVEWGDCDAAGIVFYPRYFEYFDACTNRLFEAALGTKKRQWTAHYGIVGIPMVDTRARYHSPSRYGDVLEFTTTVTALGGASFEIAHRVTNAGTVGVEGVEKRVWAGRHADDPSRLTGHRIPDEVRERLGG